MKILGNLIWLVFGGFAIFLEYMVAGLLLCITIIGIPFGLQSFKLGILALWPFGQKIEYMDYAPGCLSTFMNIIWFFIGGVWIMLTHLFFGILLGITIIGIPWAKQHFKMASLALTPFGRRVVWRRQKSEDRRQKSGEKRSLVIGHWQPFVDPVTRHPASSILYPASGIQYPASRIPLSLPIFTFFFNIHKPFDY